MLAADVLDFLKLIVIGKEGAESFECLVVAVLCTETALPVVSCKLVQLHDL
jgi:hypothetical protein